MEKIRNFIRTYFREICFVLLLTYLVSALLSCADAQTVNGSVYGVFGLTMLVLLFCLGIWILSKNASTAREIERFSLVGAFSLIASLCVLAVYSRFLLHTFSASELIRLGMCGAVCATVCGCYIDARRDKLKAMEKLQQDDPDNFLRTLIKQKSLLTLEQQLKLFDLPDAEYWLASYMSYESLEPEAEIILIGKPYLLRMMVNNPTYLFSRESVACMFVQPDAGELVLTHIQNGNGLANDLVLKMFDLPNASEVVAAYICNAPLPDAGELRLFELPNAHELIDYYLDKYGSLGDEAMSLAHEKGWIN